jgi:hypothetical protein
VAVDATGRAPGALSTCFVTRACDRGAGGTWRPWLKWGVVVDVPRRSLRTPVATPGPTNDGATLRPVLDRARSLAPIRCVLAAGACDRELNHTVIRQTVGAHSSIPATRGKRTWHLQGVRAQLRAEFPAARSRQRSLVESVCAAAKRTLCARAAGRSSPTQERPALLVGGAYQLYRLRLRLPLALLMC